MWVTALPWCPGVHMVSTYATQVRLELQLIGVLAEQPKILLLHERMENYKELLWDHLPPTSLPPLGGCHEAVSNGLLGSDEVKASLTASSAFTG